MVRQLVMGSSKILSFMVLMGGLLLGTSSVSWWGIWVSLEISMLGVCGIFIGEVSQDEVSSCFKYFLVQALSSVFLLMSFLSRDWLPFMSSFSEVGVVFSLMMKSGVFPFHLWVIPVMSGISWSGAWLLCTLQKLVPLLCLGNLVSPYPFVSEISSVMGVFISGYEGMRQLTLRGLFAYYSILSSSWLMVMSSLCGSFLFFFYFWVNSFTLFSLFWVFGNSQAYSYGYFGGNISLGEMVLMTSGIMSLLGLPPLVGFFPKAITLYHLIASSWVLSVLLAIGSIMGVWFCLCAIMNFLLKNEGVNWGFTKPSKFSVFGVFFIFFFSLFNIFGGLIFFVL